MKEGTGNGWGVLDPGWELLGLLESQGDLGLARRDRERGGTDRANDFYIREGAS